MKKTYAKPEICFESFLMSANIAAGCEIKSNTNTNYNQCGYQLEGVNLIIFGTDLNGCNKYGDFDRQVAPNGAYDDLCYHVPNEANNIFNS